MTSIFGDNFPKKMVPDSVRYSLYSPTAEIKLENTKSNQKLRYVPNAPVSAGFAIDKDYISLGVNFIQPGDKTDNEQSRFIDYFLRLPLYKGLFELFYTEFKGYELEGVENEKLLDIDSRTYGAYYKFYFNPKYNLKEQTGHFSLKREPGYSTFLNIGLAKTVVDSSTSLVPSELSADFSDYVNLKGLSQDSLSIIYGISGQYLFKKYFVQGSFGIGINLSKVKYKGGELENSTKTSSSYQTQWSLGYQFTKSLLGVEFNVINITDLQNDNQLSTSRGDITFYYKYFF